MKRTPRVYVTYTGGTVGMKKSAAHGYQPAPGYLQEQMARIPAFHAPDVPEFVIRQYQPLLDSSDMTPRDWLNIAQDIAGHYDEFDGFLVIHGTDTMAYTASALSFMLENLQKPVLLTGSQIPLCETRNDAQENLLTALVLLGRYSSRIAEVCLYFGNQLLRGNRTTKISTEGFAAFASPNFPPLATVGVDFDFQWSLVRGPRPGAAPLRVRAIGDATVAAFRLFPGFKAEYLAGWLAPPLRGLVLECFGAGNAPAKNREFLEVLSAAAARGVVIVDVPQPRHGAADLSLYPGGKALQEAGVVCGYDMTPEAALTKLLYLLACHDDPAAVKELVQRDLRGELSPPEA